MDYCVLFQKISTLSNDQMERMAKIYFQFYAGSNKERFFSDLQVKDEVLILTYQDTIVGFSTVQFYEHQNQLIVYSGDTLVIPQHWQQQYLHKAWIERMGLLKQEHSNRKIYWFLLVKGYRTYKFLKVFAKQFYPHWQNEHPELKTLADQLAQDKFGSLYNKMRGVVECPPEYGFLKEELAIISPQVKQKPCAELFLARNPYYYQGHELVCLCEIAKENITTKFQPYFTQAGEQ